MRNIVIAISLLVIAACNKAPEQKGFSIKGKIRNLGGTSVTLQELTTKGVVFLDSATVTADGSFELKGSVSERTFAVIQLPAGSVLLVVDSLSDMVLSIDAARPEEFSVNGSSETVKLKELLKTNFEYMKRMQALETKYAAYSNSVPPLSVQEQIRHDYDSVIRDHHAAVSAYILSLENSIVPYFASNYAYFQMDKEFDFIRKVDEKYYKDFMQSKYAQELHHKVEILGKTAVGSQAPDIVLADPFGKTISLSSLRGKTVLVDFWASWCRPCREESPNLVKAYNKYKTRGFEVFSVSLDDNREAWQKAINDDKLLWTHVSDLQKWNSAVVSQYNIESIPFTVLVDAEGKIIAKNLRGKELEDKLAEVLK